MTTAVAPEVFVSDEVLREMMYMSMRRACSTIPKDIQAAVRRNLEMEKNEIPRFHLLTTLQNYERSEEVDGLLCTDTGWPLYYVKAGDNVRLEKGWSSLYEAARYAVRRCSAEARLRVTMVDPLSRRITTDNVGPFIPQVEVRFDAGIEELQVLAAPKGGGAEIWGSFYRPLMVADGTAGIYKFCLDAYRESHKYGKACPPTVVGIGIGGTPDLCMRLAKEACLLRPVGDRHPDPRVANMEEELIDAFNYCGMGPMGMGGESGSMDVHIEIAVTHTAATCIAFNTQCQVGRRAVAKYGLSGAIGYDDILDWVRR
ncbi:MAG: fumarate hydratase [Nitrospinota bacterium]